MRGLSTQPSMQVCKSSKCVSTRWRIFVRLNRCQRLSNPAKTAMAAHFFARRQRHVFQGSMTKSANAPGLRTRTLEARRRPARCNRGRRTAIAFSTVSQSSASGRGLSARAATSIARSWSSPSLCPRSRNRLVNASICVGRSPPSSRTSYHKSLTPFRSSCRFASVALSRATARARRAFLQGAPLIRFATILS
jgi:hypothetical protein